MPIKEASLIHIIPVRVVYKFMLSRKKIAQLKGPTFQLTLNWVCRAVFHNARHLRSAFLLQANDYVKLTQGTGAYNE